MIDDLYSSPRIALALEGRDEEIAFFQEFLRNLGRVGIRNTTYAWVTGSEHPSGKTDTRGCTTRYFDAHTHDGSPTTISGVYSEDRLWENYHYFVDKVMPVAEEAGVMMQLHPNDPPLVSSRIPRIFRSTESFRKSVPICNRSPAAGILFCVGTWGEMPGSDGNGEDVAAALREFVGDNRVRQLHFRNVSSPLPQFTETFPNDGYLDLPELVRILAEEDFDGILVPDHVPKSGIEDREASFTEAYCLGYLRSLMNVYRD